MRRSLRHLHNEHPAICSFKRQGRQRTQESAYFVSHSEQIRGLDPTRTELVELVRVSLLRGLKAG